MANYRYDENRRTRHRGGVGRTILILLAIAAIIVAILFASGFWSADVKKGALPDVNVSVKGGALPDVDLNSKEVVVGTKSTTVEVPKVKTEKEKINVPVVGVTNDKK